MPMRDLLLTDNPVVIVLIAIGIRWLYGWITGNRAESFQALILWGMIAGIVYYVVLLVFPVGLEKLAALRKRKPGPRESGDSQDPGR